MDHALYRTCLGRVRLASAEGRRHRQRTTRVRVSQRWDQDQEATRQRTTTRCNELAWGELVPLRPKDGARQLTTTERPGNEPQPDTSPSRPRYRHVHDMATARRFDHEDIHDHQDDFVAVTMSSWNHGAIPCRRSDHVAVAAVSWRPSSPGQPFADVALADHEDMITTTMPWP